MDNTLDKIKEILEKAKALGRIYPIKKTQEELDLEKGMNNGGLGGQGSVKAGMVKPSINKMPKPGNNSKTPSVQAAPTSKKDPIKSAEQTQNKDIKDIRMKEAQSQLKQPQMVKFEKNGQWSMEKRCWDGYEPTPGKKPSEDGSCRPIKKADIDVAPEGSNNRESYKDEFEKKEDKPFHGYNKDKHSKEGGMSAKARNKHNNETGSNLKKPVTSKEAKGSDEKAGRRKSFCARMSGVKGPTSKDGKLTRKGAALDRWDCSKADEEVVLNKNGQWSMNKMEPASTMSYDDSSDKVINGSTVNETAHRGADVNIANKEPAEVTKSGYKGYTDTDNAKRKANNTTETTGIHTMNSIKQYGGSGADAAGKEAKKMRQKSKKNPVKTFTPEEIAAYEKEKKG